MSLAHTKHRRIRRGHIRTVRYHDLLRSKRAANPLSGLNPARLRRLYELYREGKYADVQLAWDALEEYDDMLGTVLNRRQAALGEMEWDVLIDARAVAGDAELQALAEQQQSTIAQRLRRVTNLTDAIKWLGLADFRRYAALEVTIDPATREERWLPIHHWLLCRPSLEGAWCYNEYAESSCSRVEPIDMSRVIMREVSRPIDLTAMFLISAKEAAVDGWDSFLEVFGNPALFFKMPPGTSDSQRDEYAKIIKEISSDGAGVYPDGGEIKTVETTAATADAFSLRAEWCDKALVRRATGGLLTVLAESGSGTLAGSAHMEAFRQLAANDAISICEAINRQYIRRILAEAHPGQPCLVYMTLTPPVVNDRAATVSMICQLASQRWRVSDQAVSEELGMEVTTEEVPAAAPGMGYPAAGVLANTAPTVELTAEPDNPPLTAAELAAFRSLSEPNTERMEQRRAEVETALRDAADLDSETTPDLLEALVANSGPGGPECEAKSVETCRCGKHPSQWKPLTMPELITPQEGRARLSSGIRLKNPLGETVTLNNALLQHWESEGKRAEDINARLSALPLIEQVVKDPAEIWESEKGGRTYLASVINPYKPGKTYTVAFTKNEDNSTLETFWTESTQIGSKRKGEKIYERADAPGT